MKYCATILLTICLLIGLSTPSSAVDFEEQLKKLAEKNAVGYLDPMATAFGTGINSGLYQSAKPHPFLPIPGFDVMIKLSVIQISDDDKVFDFYVGDPQDISVAVPGSNIDHITVDPNDIYPDRETPTVFGDDKPDTLQPANLVIVIDNALLNAGLTQPELDQFKTTADYQNLRTQAENIFQPFPTVPGTGMDLVPMAMPQVSLGLPFKSEVMLRYLPPMSAGDIGDIGFTGIGLKHSISQYIPMFPINISAMYAWQQLKVGDAVESTHSNFNLHASKGLNLLVLSIEPYVGFGIESSNLKVDYTVSNPNNDGKLPPDGTQVSFDIDGKNKSRITGGLKLGIVLPLLRITADYSVGEYTMATVGVGVSFR